MANGQRDALCRQLASHKDWQPPNNPQLRSFVTQLEILRAVDGTSFSNHVGRPDVLTCQEIQHSKTACGGSAELVEAGGCDMHQAVEAQCSRNSTQSAVQSLDFGPPALAGTCQTSKITPDSNGPDELVSFPVIIPDHCGQTEHRGSCDTFQKHGELIHETSRAVGRVGQGQALRRLLLNDAHTSSLMTKRHIIWVGVPPGPENIKENPYLHIPAASRTWKSLKRSIPRSKLLPKT